MGEQVNEPVSFGDAATEPVDLAQAFKFLNQANREGAQPPVEEEAPAAGVAESDGQREPGISEQPVQGAAQDNSAPAGTGDSSGASYGGSSDGIQAIDFDARRQEILRGVQQQALSDVRQEFKNNGIEYCSIDQLWKKDEQTGRVTFQNPDDPRNPFTSRAEAQAWVDAFNKQIDSRFRQEVNKKQQELMGNTAPTLRLINFAPKYQAMSQDEKDIMDDLLDGYGVKDRSGRIVGYNVDLDAVAAQAKRIAKRMAPRAPETLPEAPKSSGPAMDMPTGQGTRNDTKEPKTIGEALKMYDSQKKGRK